MKGAAPSAWRNFGTKRIQSSSPAANDEDRKEQDDNVALEPEELRQSRRGVPHEVQAVEVTRRWHST